MPDGETKTADAEKEIQHQKTWSDDEVKKIIEERDKAKEKSRKYEDEQKKLAEAKAIEEGKLKELLQQKEAENILLREKSDRFEQSQTKLKEQTLAKITDVDLKKFAEKLPTLEDIVEFADKIDSKKLSSHNGKHTTTTEPKKYKSAAEWQNDLAASGLAK